MSNAAEGHLGDWLPHKESCRCVDCRCDRAEARVAELASENKRLRECVVIACRSGKFGNPEAAAAKIIERSFPREEAKHG